MKKNLLFSFLTVMVGFILIMNQSNAEYSEDFQNAYKFAYKNGITTVSNIDKAKLNSPLTRIAMAKMLSKYAVNVLGKQPVNSNVPVFSDISNKLNEDYDGAVTLAYQLGIMGINMKNNKFRPYDTVTRAEFGTALSRLLYGTPDGSPYYVTHLDKLKREGIISNTQSKLQEKRGYVMLMLMRSQNNGTASYSNNIQNNIQNNTPNNTSNDTNNTTNIGYLTQEEVKRTIEKEEGLKEGSLSLEGYECDGETCTYVFEYTIDGKRYYYHRNNKVGGETIKLQYPSNNNIEEIALKDAKVSRDEVEIQLGRSIFDRYVITIKAKDTVFVYLITQDGKIEEKKMLITEKNALAITLKEIKLEQSQSDIEKGREEICMLDFNLNDNEHDIYYCRFTYLGKHYRSYINAHDGSVISIEEESASEENQY